MQYRKKDGTKANVTYCSLTISRIKTETAQAYSLIIDEYPGEFASTTLDNT